MRRYDAVLFDAGETLLRPDPSFSDLIAALLRERGLLLNPEDAVDHALGKVFRAAMEDLLRTGGQFSTSAERSRAFWTGLYRTLLGELGVAGELDSHATFLYEEFSRPERYALFPDTLPALRELRARGYTLGIVSNWEEWLIRLLERLDVRSLLAVVVVSGSEGIEKPDPEIFRRALERIGVPAERSAYVGDNPRVDIEPALALGMGAVLVDRRGVHDGHRGVVVRSLEQIPAVLG